MSLTSFRRLIDIVYVCLLDQVGRKQDFKHNYERWTHRLFCEVLFNFFSFHHSVLLRLFIWWYEKLILELPKDCTICIKILCHRSRKNCSWRLTANLMERILLWSIFYAHFDIPYSHWYCKLILKISSFLGKSWYFTFLWFTFLKNIALSNLHFRKESLKEIFFRHCERLDDFNMKFHYLKAFIQMLGATI